MRLDQNIGLQDFGRQVGTRSFVAGILVISQIVPWPAIEAPFQDAGDVVRNEVVSQAVPFIYRSPQVAGFGLNGNPDRVSDTPGVGRSI